MCRDSCRAPIAKHTLPGGSGATSVVGGLTCGSQSDDIMAVELSREGRGEAVPSRCIVKIGQKVTITEVTCRAIAPTLASLAMAGPVFTSHQYAHTQCCTYSWKISAAMATIELHCLTLAQTTRQSNPQLFPSGKRGN